MDTINSCCINCNNEIQRAIIQSMQDNRFIFSAFIVLALIIGFLFYLANKQCYRNVPVESGQLIALSCTAIVLGIGVGGFIDGIVLHQILQWHEMLSNKFPANTVIYKSMNMFWDGIFHLFTLLVTITGIHLLWKVHRKTEIRKSGNILVGGMLVGWGIFNLVEGIINHQILELHNVREISEEKNLWNYGFLFFGIVLIGIGWLIINSTKKKSNYK